MKILKKGFSLAELLIALAIVSIIATLGFTIAKKNVEKAYNFLMLGEKQLQESKELMKGKISMGVPTVISVNFLNEYIKKFTTEHPNIVIKMADTEIDKLLYLIQSLTVSIGIFKYLLTISSWEILLSI